MARIRIKSKRGGRRKLDDLAKALKDAPDVLKTISRAAAEESLDLVKQGFRDQTDPYGKPWKPKKVDDGRGILSGETSRLKGGWHIVKADKRGFSVAPSVDYAVHHQFGAPRAGIAQRKIIPAGGKLPKVYVAAITEAAEEALTELFRDVGRGGGSSGPGLKLPRIGGINVMSLMRRAIKAANG